MNRAILIALTLLALTHAAMAAPAELGDVWTETGFDRLAVQTAGMEKSLATFARDSLREIALRRQIREDDRVTLTLLLASRPGLLADRWLIPVEGDMLLPLLEEVGITVDHRTLRLGDCLRFDSSGQVVGEGRALAAARQVLISTQQGDPVHSSALRLFSRINAVADLGPALRLIPDPNDPEGSWHTAEEAQRLGIEGAEEARGHLDALFEAVAADDAEAARPAAEALVSLLPTLPNYTSSTRLAIDHAYTVRKPYFWASFAYVVSAILFFVALVTRGDRWWLAAMIAMGAGWIVHVLGAAARGYLIQRMPLSNLYEATTTGLVFIILFALIFEGMHRMRVVGFSAAALSFVYYRWLLSSDVYGNDAIEPLRAVLNSYWLDYHVTCMMLSYGAFTIAFAMAVLYLMRRHMPRLMRWTPSLEDLDLYIYRAIQFGWPLLGIGIVLGAVWADTAWGRMWSWDPKETWSLITWLIYTGFLHVRLVHGWRGVGMAWASIGGYAAVLFTYLGVNFVLSGLHSYAGNSPAITAGEGTQRMILWSVVVVAALAVAAAGVWWSLRQGQSRDGVEES
jgi:cytochrome c-type biogenesis protein CcsB